MNEELKHIYDVQKEVSLLYNVSALLEWDQQTHMPKKGVMSRAETTKYISGLAHDKLSSNKLWSSLNKVRRSRMSTRDTMVVKELRKQIKKVRRIPTSFVREFSKEATLAHTAWEKARNRKSYMLFAPNLTKLVSLSRKHAHYLNPRVQPYDALIDEFEEGMNVRKYTRMFKYLRKELVAVLDDLTATKQYKRQKPLKMTIPAERQQKVSEHIAKKMGVTPDRVAIDISTHPFSLMAGHNDVRITTRYNEPLESFGSTVHESGHALYDLGLPEKHLYTVLHDAPSHGLHESQSRFWENMVAKSAPFWKGYAPHFSRLGATKKSWKQCYRGVNFVKRSFTRVEADEVTYNLHIILRFEMERDLMNGKLSVKDVPHVWNERFQDLMGLKVKNDVQGCLQDVHWSGGMFGYFPSYCVGSIYASQLYNQLVKEKPSTQTLIRQLRFKPLIDWLGGKVHSKGKTMLADDIIRKVCGEGLNPKVFIQYLREKYGELYGF